MVHVIDYIQEAAEEIIMTVGQAFEVAYQAVIKARGHRSSKSVAVECAVDYSPTTKPVSDVC